MNRDSRTSPARAALCLLASGLSLVSSLAAQTDRRAGYAIMFNGSTPPGGLTPRLLGGAPPVIGQTMSLTLRAPEYQLGTVLLASRPTNSGLALPLGSHVLAIYIDPTRLLLTLPGSVASGQMTLTFALPNVSSAVGVDLAWQGAVVDYASRLGASNLLLSNFGTSALLGNIVFAAQFTGRIASHDWLKDASGNKQSIFCNDGTTPVRVRIKGTKTANVGPLEFMTGNSSAYKMVPAADGTFDFTMDVPPGLCVNVFNADSTQPMDVTWTVGIEP